MNVRMMKCKLHRAAVTQADLHYEGSIGIDKDYLEAAGIRAHEYVDVWNISNGQRFHTYAIEAPRGSRAFAVNGAAARLVSPGDRIIVVAWAEMSEAEADIHEPTVVLLDEHNQVVRPTQTALSLTA